MLVGAECPAYNIYADSRLPAIPVRTPFVVHDRDVPFYESSILRCIVTLRLRTNPVYTSMQ